MPQKISMDKLLTVLRAAGEPTRLQLLALLSKGEHNVKDLTKILGQSQPRLSRHLKLLGDAGLIERFREGSWVYFRLCDGNSVSALVRHIIGSLDPRESVINRALAAAQNVKHERAKSAQAYFRRHVEKWDEIRALHIAESDVENAILEAFDEKEIGLLIDFGTGTGRILELFSDRIEHGIGLDVNYDMLAYARAKLEKADLNHCQVRHGDLFHLSMADGLADAVVIHQVLHFLEEPLEVLKEAARILKPGGKCLIVDFAPHDLEFLREDYAHQRLGFSNQQMTRWMSRAGLSQENYRTLKPAGKPKGDKLTVSIWLARKEKSDTEKSSAKDTFNLMELTP